MTRDPKQSGYVLDEQIGFIMRVASQRHGGIFSNLMIEGLTPMRFAVLAKLSEQGALAQNELGRQTAMDVATIKGVVDRLRMRGLVMTGPDPSDGRKVLVTPSAKGETVFAEAVKRAVRITEETLKPLNQSERVQLVSLLKKIT